MALIKPSKLVETVDSSIVEQCTASFHKHVSVECLFKSTGMVNVPTPAIFATLLNL